MNGAQLDDRGRSWSAKTLAKPLAVRGAWPLRHSPPIVWADAAGRPDVKDLARAHREASEGEVEQGLVHDWNEVQLVFREPRGHWRVLTAQNETQSAVQSTCRSCGTTLESARKTYCSPACRQRAYRQRKRMDGP
jgi:hypothetical protein